MSIIHDALKKVQQGLSEEKKENTGYLYSTPSETPPKIVKEKPVERLTSTKSQIKSLLAMLCAILITGACIVLLIHQINTYFPDLLRTVKSSYYRLIHKEEVPDFKTKKVLVPLAKITVLPPAPKPVIPPATPAAARPITTNTATAAIPAPPAETKPQTLNIHGVMSNGSQNVVLIDDQVYQEGDEVDGIKILKINLDSITILNNGQEQSIRVKN